MSTDSSNSPQRDDPVDFDTVAADSLPRLSVGVAVVLTIWMCIHLYTAAGPRQYMLGLTAGVSATLLAAYAGILHRWRDAERRRGNTWAAFILVIGQVNCLLPVATIPRVIHHVDVVFCILGASCVFLSRRWCAFSIVSTLTLWLVFSQPLANDPAWRDANFTLFATAALGFLVHETRRNVIVRLTRLQQEAEFNRRLAETSHAANSMFLANMSHEVRTPMTAILGFADVLAHSEESSERLHAEQMLRRSADHLLTILDDILDLSRVEAGHVNLNVATVSIANVAEQVCGIEQPRASSKGLELSVERRGDIPSTIFTDEVRLRQILLNLVGNAVKFTESGSVRIVLVGRDDNSIQIDVHDTGPGIPENVVPSLFEPFTQLDPTATRRHGGSGLGLAICLRLVTVLDGTIEVQSEPGVGSTFQVLLPIGIEVPPENEGTQSQSPDSGEAEPRQLQRVLLAEDSPDIQALLCLLLRKAGVDVVSAENGAEAVLAVETTDEPFDIVLMHVQMPVMDGLAATKVLRKQGFEGPIVALTAHAMEIHREQCLHAGCDDHLSKPIDPRSFVEIVGRIANRVADSSVPRSVRV